MRVDDAIARIIGAANPNAPTWMTEVVNTLTTAGLAGEAARDRSTLERAIRADAET
ncbi:MAG: hypothetical protein INR66_14895, partial [Gordonia polyisoprenivorans]|nr:hypothetical protein [Gordonia polyisoprenivorans]